MRGDATRAAEYRRDEGEVVVLIIEAEAGRRESLARCLGAVGVRVTAVAGIADVIRWPDGEIVVTDFPHFTPLWVAVGASHVVVLTDSFQEGAEACRQGATTWVPRLSPPDDLLAALRDIGALPSAVPGEAAARNADPLVVTVRD